MSIARGLLIALVALLAGCQVEQPKPDAPPNVVQVQVKAFVPIDPSLTAPCPIEMPRDRSGTELIRVARERRAALEACNRQLQDIQSLQPKETQP